MNSMIRRLACNLQASKHAFYGGLKLANIRTFSSHPNRYPGHNHGNNSSAGNSIPDNPYGVLNSPNGFEKPIDRPPRRQRTTPYAKRGNGDMWASVQNKSEENLIPNTVNQEDRLYNRSIFSAKNMENTLEAHNYQMNLCIKEQDFEGVEELFAKTIRLGLTPSIRSYTILLTSRLRANKLDDALKVFELASEAEIRPDVAMYNRVLSYYSSRHSAQAALELYKSMREKGIVPEPLSLQYVITSLISRLRVDEARQFFEAETSEGDISPTPDCFTQLVRGYVEAERSNDALAFLKSKQSVIAPALMVRCANLVIKGMLQKGEFTKAFVLVEAMQSLGTDLDHVTYNLVLHAAVKSRDIATATALFNKMRDLSGRFVLSSGDHEKIQAYHQQLTQMTKQERQNREQIAGAFTYNIMIEGYLEQNDYTNAFALLNEMAHYRIPIGTVTFNIMLDHFAGKKNWAAISFLRNRMIELKINADTVTFNVFIAAAGSRCDANAIRTLLQTMTELRLRKTSYTYTSAMRGFCACGDMVTATSMLEEMKKDGLEPNVVSYTVLVAGHGRLGQISAATDIFELMKSNKVMPNRVTYSIFISSCLTSGAWEKAEDLINDMMRDNMRPDYAVFGRLISGYKRDGEESKAQRIKDLVTELATKDELLKQGRSAPVSKPDKHGRFVPKHRGHRALKRLVDVVSQ